eukprot:CAMPEP_0175815848 /NCGR_PEP_ID=MMETSP0107_2-20121207/6189_1 /TAXON_ID=195067 ORGANISM="Goniomonas pacifica, Strain CCMP1869" /NCGR_SAMPLE_ID=MMETSP0107_2 /ASSEMBLY_ACC=CAM_ASM_000203 /LENGTH=58 /DNA_ID=CAMNT_0017127925 /DNA_START=218 /DNA_END=392 /DNA_ORIENTATION=+
MSNIMMLQQNPADHDELQVLGLPQAMPSDLSATPLTRSTEHDLHSAQLQQAPPPDLPS